MSSQRRSALPGVASAVKAVSPVQPGTFNPCQMFRLAAHSMLNPYATGYTTVSPLYGMAPTPAAAIASYSRGMATGLARVQRSWAASTVDGRTRVQQELSRWLASQPAIFGKSWQNLEPLDIICFMETVWIPHHAGAELPDGKGKVVAPSSLNGTISHISTSMRLIGRTGDWDSLGRLWPSICNPACCELLRNYKRGYAKDVKAMGYEPCSAFPLAESVYLELLDRLHQRATEQAAQGDQLGAAITWRDGCSISNLWETALRGHDGGILRVPSIKGMDGRPVLPFAAPPPAGDYLVYPWSTKVRQVDPCEPIRVTYPSDPAQQRRSFIYWLYRLQQASAALQQPLHDFLFRPTEGPAFMERPMSSAAIHERFVSHLRGYALYEGQSLHGIRRGTMQNDAQAGAPFPNIQERAQIKTDRIVRLYLDPAAHLRGGKGQKRLRGAEESDDEA